ncbi:ATP-dependent helicase [Mycoplasma procyoni]|uniref:ATP-dependent helicase n=1 Tax=Mycoplasma procyoni TaxID=568784 RepID=UPI00197C6749|nr:UvrD-helicase domain-containing protein [Mycoplasma procyoni]MBN3534555.1 UvrD-helicase domain-containing protein [Mycoplasma procyoni]
MVNADHQKVDLIANLNKEQKAAVLYNKGHLRIIAGAGSGKTGVLTRKIAYLIQEELANPSEILAVTFTNKATQEMQERVVDLIGQKGASAFITTFHSLCNHILRREIEVLEGYNSGFDILDASDQKSILENIYRKLSITNKDITYGSALDRISKWKNNEIEPEDIKVESLEEDEEIHFQIYKQYHQQTQELKALDFDDLLIFVAKIFKNFPNIQKKWANKFKYILVDEFQDTSELQFDIVKSLTSTNAILTIVGDPDQTIYTWRGADPDLIVNFSDFYKDTTTITLAQNYRSTQIILSAANSLIKNNKNRLEKNLFTENEGEDEIQFYHAFNMESEARWVVHKIDELKKKKVQLKNIAILYRSNFYSRAFEEALINENIPYQLLGGQKFFERKVIKDAIAYLKVINDGSTVGLLRIINVPSRKIGPVAIQKIVEFANNKNMSPFECLIDYFGNLKQLKTQANFQELPLSHNLQKEVVKFLNDINWSRKMIKDGHPIHAILEKFLERIKYMQSMKVQPNEKHEAQQNINELLAAIKSWENKNKDKGLNAYLDEISLLTDSDELGSSFGGITLMTAHSSKGLEFQNVFLVGMSEGIFPSRRSLEDKDIEEERRLAYVAVTRAKERLFISDSGGSFYDNNQLSQTSRFVSEMGIKSEKLLNFTRISQDGKLNYSKDDKAAELIAGDIVNHIVFGQGIVLEIQGDVAVIKFQKDGLIKTLLKNHKSLEKIQL